MVLVIYSAWSSPFELAFKKAAIGSLLRVDLAVDAFFAIDIVLTFFVAYLDKSTYLLVDDHKKIGTRYILLLLITKSRCRRPWSVLVGVVNKKTMIYFYNVLHILTHTKCTL